jgi:AmiR/NasT family two-component response regulator
MARPQQAHDDQEVVWQAEGVLMEVLGCGARAAGAVLRLLAHADERSLVEVAADVLAGRREWLFDFRV